MDVMETRHMISRPINRIQKIVSDPHRTSGNTA